MPAATPDLPKGNASLPEKLPAIRAAVLFPVVAFYGFLAAMATNIPWLDDYDAGLNFADQLVKQQGFGARFLYFLGAQHNEYKIFVGHGLVWAEVALTGHVNFAVLSLIGDLSVLLLGWILWRMFLPEVRLERRLLLFVPVTLLLFQYQYVETLNWPLPGVQNLPILGMAVAGLYFLEGGNFAAGAAFMVLGIATSGNGFLVAVVGVAMLGWRRLWSRLAAWLAVAGGCAAVYAFHYQVKAPAGAGRHGIVYSLLHLKVVFVLSFLGASGRYPVQAGAVLMGLALCLFFGRAVRRGFLRQEPVVAYCLLFVLLTAVGVAGIRSDLGLAQSVSSRYRMYSDLLLIFAWFAVVREYRLAELASLRTSRMYRRTVAGCALFWLGMNLIGARNLYLREAALKEGMRRFETSGGAVSPVYSPDGNVQGYKGFGEHARPILLEAEKAGIYQPKQY